MVLRGMTETLKTSPRSFCDCLLPVHATSGPGVTARSLRCLASEAQSLRCPPSLLRHPFAFRTGRPLPRLMYLFGLRPLHLSGTRLEGGHRRLFRTLRFVGVEPTKQRRFGCQLIAIAMNGNACASTTAVTTGFGSHS